MEWMLAVLALVLLWWYLQQRRPPPVEPKPLPDPRKLLAQELEEVAETARKEGHREQAQVLALRSTWLKTSPRLGDDTPPTVLDPNDSRHLRFAGELWAQHQSKQTHCDEARHHEPQSAASLPYPKESIIQALDMLIGIGERRVSSVHVDPDHVSQDVLDEMREARDELNRTVYDGPEAGRL
jgi:hypothetical protein